MIDFRKDQNQIPNFITELEIWIWSANKILPTRHFALAVRE